MKTLIRILFGILNGIVFCAFTLPYFLTVPPKGDLFYSHFWSEPFTWVILALFLSTFPMKFQAVQKIRKRDQHFKFETGPLIFWFIVRLTLTGIWISWMMNEAVLNQDIFGGITFSCAFIGLILILYWMYYGKKARKTNEGLLDETLAKVLSVCPSANRDEIAKLGSLLKNSKLYDKKDDPFSQILVGSPGRSFIVRNRTKQFEHADKHDSIEGKSSIHSHTWKEWQFYFCVLITSSRPLTPGLYSKSDFLSFFEKTTSEKYNSVLSPFKVSSIEITGSGYVIGIEPGYDIGSMGIKVPSQKDLDQLFLAFAN